MVKNTGWNRDGGPVAFFSAGGCRFQWWLKE
jgi:hypothetical protein